MGAQTEAPPAERDAGDARWHSLGLLDDHIKSLKKQIEVLAQELRTAVAERDALLSELGVLQWPGLERDARFLLKLPGSGRKGSGVEWRFECKNGADGGEDGEGRRAHKRGQSWGGWDNKAGRRGAGGRKLGRSRIRSMDADLGMENLPFGGALPTHRGPTPDACEARETPEGEGEPEAREECGECEADTPKSGASALPPIDENEAEAAAESAEDSGESEAVFDDLPDSPSSVTDSERSEGGHGDTEGPSEGRSQDQEKCAEQESAASTEGVVWLSNGAFHRTAVDSPTPSTDSETGPEAAVSAHHPQVRMRTTHVALVERANRAARLSKELFQAKFALHDSQSQLQFLSEKMMMYKNTFQDEVRRHEEETCRLRSMLNEATTSKFIMFCKLSECQEKVQQLEEHLVLSRAMGTRSNLGAIDENADQTGKDVLTKVPEEESEKVMMSPRWVRGSSMSTIERGAGKVAQNSVGSDLQLRLTETMRRLLEAENRGDQLQHRLKELETQLKKRSADDTKSVLSTARSSTSASSKRSNQNHTWNELKQTRLELKRTRIQLHKCEGELSSSNKIRHQQEEAIGKLKKELKEVKRRKPPSWR
ncbi:unnamed protein product [Ostreobium quekettii]|uniref:Uncharacterized protein n=1 Tax=Ostreobium quekettii TaxID=121088 RepID=A0A8S1J8Y8_9CHLO|nr:unnamed protein product [Ostreobium quekettii]